MLLSFISSDVPVAHLVNLAGLAGFPGTFDLCVIFVVILYFFFLGLYFFLCWCFCFWPSGWEARAPWGDRG